MLFRSEMLGAGQHGRGEEGGGTAPARRPGLRPRDGGREDDGRAAHGEQRRQDGEEASPCCARGRGRARRGHPWPRRPVLYREGEGGAAGDEREAGELGCGRGAGREEQASVAGPAVEQAAAGGVCKGEEEARTGGGAQGRRGVARGGASAREEWQLAGKETAGGRRPDAWDGGRRDAREVGARRRRVEAQRGGSLGEFPVRVRSMRQRALGGADDCVREPAAVGGAGWGVGPGLGGDLGFAGWVGRLAGLP